MTTCPAPDGPHQVYELWNDGVCAYVGQTADLSRRMNEHRARTRGLEVRTIECASHEEALTVERERIAALRPTGNSHGVQAASAARQIAEYYIPNLGETVGGMRKDGLSWRAIAKAISAELPSDLSITHETLRTWAAREGWGGVTTRTERGGLVVASTAGPRSDDDVAALIEAWRNQD